VDGERRNRTLLDVNEDFKHLPTANGGGAVDLEQVLRKRTAKLTWGEAAYLLSS
jgi:hypothetical protein